MNGVFKNLVKKKSIAVDIVEKELNASALKETKFAPPDCAPLTPLINPCVLSIGSLFPVTRQIPSFS